MKTWELPKAWNFNWQDEVKISDELAKYRTAYINMSSEFQLMWDGHLARNEAAQHRIELPSGDTWPTPLHAKSSWAQSVWVEIQWKSWDVCDGSHWTGSNRVGIAYFLPTEKWWSAQILCWLQRTQCSDLARFLSPSLNGLSPGMIERHHDFISIGCGQHLLASPNCHKTERNLQNCFCATSWIISDYSHAFG